MSFDWLGQFRQGAWKDFRRFVLEERRDVGNRMMVINSELTRIGWIHVHYATTEDEDGQPVVTEQRTGLAVPPQSSLGKLIQAYVALGGNPLSISHFLLPGMRQVDANGNLVDVFPSGGVVYPVKGDISKNQYDGGFKSLDSDPQRRVGGRRRYDQSRVVFHVDHSRRWVAKEIREKRYNVESRIIKLMDLREQLEQELLDLVLAVGGTVSTIPTPDRKRFEAAFNVASLVHFMDAVFYAEDDDGELTFDTENTAALAYYPFLMSDLDVEGGTEL